MHAPSRAFFGPTSFGILIADSRIWSIVVEEGKVFVQSVSEKMSSTKWKPLDIGEGKALPDEQVEFILIGAGLQLDNCSNLED